MRDFLTSTLNLSGTDIVVFIILGGFTLIVLAFYVAFTLYSSSQTGSIIDPNQLNNEPQHTQSDESEYH